MGFAIGNKYGQRSAGKSRQAGCSDQRARAMMEAYLTQPIPFHGKTARPIEEIINIVRARLAGVSLRELAEAYGVGRERIRQISLTAMALARKRTG